MERYFKDKYKVLATYKHHDGKYLKLLQEICDTPKKRKRHYAAWGNTEDPDLMGTVELLTAKGYPRTKGGIVNHFHEMISGLDKIEFDK